MKLKEIVGAGDRVMLVALPVLVIGVALNLLSPDWFAVGGVWSPAFWCGAVLLGIGLVGWLWSVALILLHVPRGRFITGGPFRIVRHPLYLAIGLLVLPGLGLMLNTWAGLPVGAAIWLGSRLFGGSEERFLAEKFGGDYQRYRERIFIPWL